MFLNQERVEDIVIVRARTGLVPILPHAGRLTIPNFMCLHSLHVMGDQFLFLHFARIGFCLEGLFLSDKKQDLSSSQVMTVFRRPPAHLVRPAVPFRFFWL